MKQSLRLTLAFMAVSLLACAVFFLAVRIGTPVPAGAALALGAAAAAGVGAARWAQSPLERLAQGADMLLSGRADAPIEARSNDVAGRIALRLDRMAEQLRKSTAAVETLQQETAACRGTERELRDREEHYRRLFEYSNDAVFIYDFDGRIQDVNNKACQMLAFSREEILAIPFLELQPQEELGRSKAAFKTSTKTGSLRFESLFRRKDGSVLNVEISSSIVDLRRGIMQSIVSNITERKEIEKSLRDSEEKFRTFMETATDLMFITDEEANFIYVNDAMLRTLGYSREEMIGMPFMEVLDRDRLAEARANRQRFMDGGENTHQLVWETKTRRKIHGEMKATGIYHSDGRFRGIRGVFRDITERKKIEESQRLAQLGKLASDMAHEVNNQIAVIATRTQVAKLRIGKPEQVLEDLGIIADQCDQIKNIVKRLLLFSKPSRGDFKPLDVNTALKLVVRLVEDQFVQHGVRITVDFAEGLPAVKADEKQIQEVCMNLLRNAFEAMPDGGDIRVSTSLLLDAVQIDVTDTGSGISEADLKRIFDPFFTTKETGTGLGLSVCYGIVQAHRGELKYTSTLGRGTTAHLVLPTLEV
jgi:PAS domain S-box-containing protein